MYYTLYLLISLKNLIADKVGHYVFTNIVSVYWLMDIFDPGLSMKNEGEKILLSKLIKT